MQCPSCGAMARLSQTTAKITHFGELLFSTLSCEKCGFRLSDVLSLSFKKPMRFKARVVGEKGLSIKIVKSSTATVRIPELGVEIEPSQASDGYYSNVEGLLDRIEQATGLFLHTAKSRGERTAVERALEMIGDARKARFPFTVIVDDCYGNSELIGGGVEKRRLSKKEASELKNPLVVFEKPSE